MSRTRRSSENSVLLRGVTFVALAVMPAAALAAGSQPRIDLRDLYNPSASAPIHDREAAAALVADDELEDGTRPDDLDVQHYDLDVDVDPRLGTIEGEATVTFRALAPNFRSVQLDAVDMQVESVTLATGEPLFYRYDGSVLSAELPRALAVGETAGVTVTYRALLPQGLHTTGPDVTNPERMTAAYTYTEPNGARTWYPSNDRPSDKATLTINVRVPDGYNALANGDALGEGSADSFRYRMEYPIATYLVSLAIGSYDVIGIGEFKGKPLTLWAPPTISPAALKETERTAEMMRVFSEFTGQDYPFNSYAQSVAQAYRTSMEHQSATTMGGWRITGDGSGEGVVAHELAHQWFGDWLTCRTWGELWLNEGFASYLPYVFFAAVGDESQKLGEVDYWRSGYFEQAKTVVHALSETNPDPENIFDAHAYEKGALVIHHMRTTAEALAGEGAFTRALHLYMTKNGGTNVTSNNLQAALEEATGRSWQDFFDQWVRSPGHPVLAVRSAGVQDGKLTLDVEQAQATRAENRWRTFTFPLVVELVQKDGKTRRVSFDVYDERQALEIEGAGDVVAFNVDPDWTLPAEITVDTDLANWLTVLRSSPTVTSRISAGRAAFALSHNVMPADAVALLRADRSVYLRVDAMAYMSADAANREAILAVHRDLLAARVPGSATAGALARAEEWLVQTLGQMPTREQERSWRERYVSSPVVAERGALLGMLKQASVERAQAFAIERLQEPHWVTQDRWALIELLTKTPTEASKAWIQSALATASEIYLKQIIANLTAATYDQPAIVEALLVNAKSHRNYGTRAAAVTLLGKQASSRDRVCAELPALAQAGDDSNSLANVRSAAVAASAELGCPAQ